MVTLKKEIIIPRPYVITPCNQSKQLPYLFWTVYFISLEKIYALEENASNVNVRKFLNATRNKNLLTKQK